MTEKSYRALIQALKDLYTKVSLIVLHKRISTYQINAPHKEHAKHIKSSLMEFLETTISQAVQVNDITNKNELTTKLIQPRHYQPADQNAVNTLLNRDRINELSKYFKKRSKGAELHPPIQKQLEHSVWEHMHAASRCAKNGDKRNSKMHADIVDSACKELAHYMEEEPYLEFIGRVADHLSALKPN